MLQDFPQLPSGLTAQTKLKTESRFQNRTNITEINNKKNRPSSEHSKVRINPTRRGKITHRSFPDVKPHRRAALRNQKSERSPCRKGQLCPVSGLSCPSWRRSTPLAGHLSFDRQKNFKSGGRWVKGGIYV